MPVCTAGGDMNSPVNVAEVVVRGLREATIQRLPVSETTNFWHGTHRHNADLASVL